MTARLKEIANGRRQRGGARSNVACAVPCSSCRPAFDELKKQHEELTDIMIEAGLLAFQMLDEKQKCGLLVMQYLRKKHGDLKVTTRSLHTLKPEVKRSAMDYLHEILGGNPRRKDIVHEVFRGPRKRRQDCFDAYGTESS